MGLFDKLRNTLGTSSETPSDEDDVDISFSDEKQDADFWPYYYEETDTQSIYNYEVLSEGYTLDDDVRNEVEAYAGEWPRTIMDSRGQRKQDNTWLGYMDDPVKGVEPIGVSHDSLWQHMAFFGQTGYGKSTVLRNIMYQWMHAGYGVCFIDRKGQDVKDIVQTIPEDRLDDVVWVEPGSKDFEKTVGFNFFETHREPHETGFEYEVDKIVSNFVKILEADKGQRMQSVTETITRQLVRADEPYTPVEFHYILSDEEERQVFADQFGDQLEKPFLEQLAGMEQDDLSALQRRFKLLTENKSLLNIVGHQKSSISIGEAIKDGKILLVKLSNIGDDNIQKLIATVIIRRIWAAIQERADLKPHQYDPYFLVIDEFAKIEEKEMGISEILSEARSLQLSVTLATQQLRQLSDRSRKGVENNCKSLFTFRVGSANLEDARQLSSSFEGVDPETLLDVDEFLLIGKVFMSSGDSQTVAVNTFAPYPPVRSPKKAESIIEQSMQEYGTEPIDIDEQDWDEYRISNRLEQAGKKEPDDEEDQGVAVNEHGDKITPRQVLEAVYTARIRHETQEHDGQEWVQYEDVITELNKYLDHSKSIENDTAVDNLFEKIPESQLKREFINGEVAFKLTSEGEEAAYVIQDSGSGGSAGKRLHRMVLRKGAEAFTKLGYYPTIPKQIGEEQPDGLAYPPINPREESTNINEAKELMDRLEEDYPQLTAIFDDNALALESETSTPDKPKQTLKNIAKAMNKGQKCVLLTPDGLFKKDKENLKDLTDEERKECFDDIAKQIENIINSPPCVRKIKDEKRIFYNDRPIRLDNDAVAVQRKKDKTQQIVWEEIDGRKIQARIAGEEKPFASFNSASELKNPKPHKFEYHSYRDKQRGKTVVVDNNHDIVAEYENKTERKKEWKPIYRPLIPEHIFPAGELPDNNKWEIVIIPDSSRNIEPQVYQSGNYVPLHSGDPNNPLTLEEVTEKQTSNSNMNETVQAMDYTEPDDSNSESTPEQETTQDQDSTDSETKKKPLPEKTEAKSGTEHIKDSDEVWTKPEKGDDEYNAAKDPNNFDKTSDEYHHEQGDGGAARREDEMDGMKNYETPEMKKRKKEKEKLDTETNTIEEDTKSTTEEDTKDTDDSENVPNRKRESALFNEVEV
jgi:DNA helicase HerA-like ATPase